MSKYRGSPQDDVLAEDYLININYFRSELLLEKKKFKDFIIKINKLLSHLTYYREKYKFN